MFSILHFRKELSAPPVAADAPGIQVRQLQVPEDIAAWLALRDRAMANQTPAVRSWSADDFHLEMLDKTWWRSDRSWVAVSSSSGSGPEVVGAVSLALREGLSGTVPVVHWLLVDPAFRRRGVARLLMSYLERTAWADGWREVQLETHVGWESAVAFYQSIGYAALGDRSPR